MHTHTYDSSGKMTCSCSRHQHRRSINKSGENKVTSKQKPIIDDNSGGNMDNFHKKDIDSDDDGEGSCCGHDHSHNNILNIPSYIHPLLSFILLFAGLSFSHIFQLHYFTGIAKFIWYFVAYLPVGIPVLLSAINTFKKGSYFNEFSLMSIATLGAFFIGDYPEGVAVMLFYSVGECFQEYAVKSVKNNIKALLDIRPNIAHVLRNSNYQTVKPETVSIGETIQVRVGEKIPLDGKLLSVNASLNTSALTGESKPKRYSKDEIVMAGSINLDGIINIYVTKKFTDSSISRILKLVQEASNKKSKTELLVRRLAKIYTPIVAILAVLICFLPILFLDDYVFRDWLYRSLVFLVISCPCALVISIPLGYFGGLGAASRNGLLLKGSVYLDKLTKISTIAMDKTGTLTEGVFCIENIVIDKNSGLNESSFMGLLMSLESKSNHPIAKAILKYNNLEKITHVESVKEFAGKGIKGVIEGKAILAGNIKLMHDFYIDIPDLSHIASTIIIVAIDNKYVGHVTISDKIKSEAKIAISDLRKLGIKKLVMLSGDKNSITQDVAKKLNLDNAIGALMPEDKLLEIESLKKVESNNVVFVGDGINDAPVLIASDIGIAMGGLGSDIAIETADVVIQSDNVSKIGTAIRIGHSTRMVIWQNIALAFFVKSIVLTLGATGMASMWEAVFADVGVALLAILNTIRLQKMRW